MAGVRNIGILAHIDAGKTTLTERVLLLGGAIRAAGNVDKGNTHSDTLDVERRRGISVRASCLRANWQDTEIRLIDTPGHADFASEVERALWALDGAVLVMDAAEGVQPQTELLFEALRARGVPQIWFFNKTDRESADADAALVRAKAALSPNAAFLDDDEALMELLAEHDERALETYLAGEIYPRDTLVARVQALSRDGKAYVALRGSALRGVGIEALMDAMVDFLPPPKDGDDAKLCGVVFASEADKTMGRAAHVRLFSGSLANRGALTLPGRATPLLPEPAPVQLKVSQIRALRADGRGADMGAMRAGDIAAVYGLGDLKVGTVLGDESLLPPGVGGSALRAPLFTAQAVPDDPAQLDELRRALETLSLEDPLLDVSWSERVRQLHLRVMGAIQLEVLEEELASRFGVRARFLPPAVVYRETISQPAVGFVAYTMPKPCWAVMRFELEPAPRGAGVTFDSIVPVRKIARQYQHQAQQAIPLALKQGMLGWQVDDVKITLVDGEHHLIHTHPLDFIVATPMGIHDGLRRGGSTLLEPMLDARIAAPSECAGRILSDVVAMRGETVDSASRGDTIRLRCRIPVRDSRDYPARLAAVTGGRGAMSAVPCGYRDCPLEQGATCERRGVNPLDTSRYILAARNALDGGIFDL